MRRLTPIGTIGGLAIQALTTLAVWHTPRLVWFSVVAFVILTAINVFITLVLLKRWGTARSELLRIILNVTSSLIVNHVTNWPLPTWLWLPFQALAFAGDGRWRWAVLLTTCVASVLLSLHDGVPWIVPIAFTMLSVIARVTTDARVAVVHEMHEQLKHVEVELRQAQKLEAVGRLAAGVAHEINTPLQFVGDSMYFVEEGVREILDAEKAMEEGRPIDRESLAYLRANMPEAMGLVKEGIARVTAIVSSLREFAHPSTAHAAVDVNRVVRNALTVSRHEYKNIAQVEMVFGEVPTITANANELGQVIVNLVVNAAHAVDERRSGEVTQGHIGVTTALDGGAVVIKVTDDGIGIAESSRDKIFEPFFTTKGPGRGTGQGLAISRTIAERHGGTLSFSSKRLEGSTFVLRLPV